MILLVNYPEINGELRFDQLCGEPFVLQPLGQVVTQVSHVLIKHKRMTPKYMLK